MKIEMRVINKPDSACTVRGVDDTVASTLSSKPTRKRMDRRPSAACCRAYSIERAPQGVHIACIT
jgi:hypothetical protein